MTLIHLREFFVALILLSGSAAWAARPPTVHSPVRVSKGSDVSLTHAVQQALISALSGKVITHRERREGKGFPKSVSIALRRLLQNGVNHTQAMHGAVRGILGIYGDPYADFLPTTSDRPAGRNFRSFHGDEATSVRSYKRLGNTAYVALEWFDLRAQRELLGALQTMQKQMAAPLNGMILDLRNNPGGRLQALSEIAGELFERGILYELRNRRGDLVSRVKASGLGRLTQIPLVILVNKNTASASSLLAATCQQRERALIVGDTTHPKGVGQWYIEYPGLGTASLTTNVCHPAGLESIDGKGVTPDVTSHVARDYAAALNGNSPHSDPLIAFSLGRLATRSAKAHCLAAERGEGMVEDVYIRPPVSRETSRVVYDTHAATTEINYVAAAHVVKFVRDIRMYGLRATQTATLLRGLIDGMTSVSSSH